MSNRGRPELPKGTAATTVVAVKMTDGDVLLLDALVLARSRELAASAGGARVRATRGSVLRELVRREMLARSGLSPETPILPGDPQNQAALSGKVREILAALPGAVPAIDRDETSAPEVHHGT